MMHARTHYSRGDSLVETIVYIALFIGLSALLIDSLIVMGKAYTEGRAARDVLSSAETSLSRIEGEVRAASAVNGTMSRFDAQGGALSLSGTDSQGAAETLTFTLAGGQIVVSKNLGTPVPLTDPHVSVDSLVFRDIHDGPAESIRIEATFRSLRSAVGKTLTVDDTALIRGAH